MRKEVSVRVPRARRSCGSVVWRWWRVDWMACVMLVVVYIVADIVVGQCDIEREV